MRELQSKDDAGFSSFLEDLVSTFPSYIPIQDQEHDGTKSLYETWFQTVGERNTQFLKAKLPLYSNFQDYFETIPLLKPWLLRYMFINEHFEINPAIKDMFKQKLVAAGIFNDPELLEFLLLIGEKFRSLPYVDDLSDKTDIAKHVFEQYAATNETWDPQSFQELQYTFGDSKKEVLARNEAIVFRLIAHSRADESHIIFPVSEKATKLIGDANAYFQDAYTCLFGQTSPIDLTMVTRVTTVPTEHANRINNRTYIDIRALTNPSSFVHLVMHEGFHLCFPGMEQLPLEEALIEHYLEQIFVRYPRTGFNYSPVSDVYSEWKRELIVLFQCMPGFEEILRGYVVKGDNSEVKNFLKENFTQSVRKDFHSLNQHNYGLLEYVATMAS